jgi:transcriptional regulator with XRE-family HTH domain
MKEEKTIAGRVKYIRKTLKLTQRELSQKINVSITYICDIEKGKYKPKCDFLENISRVLNVNLYWLLFGEGEMFLDPTTLVIGQSDRFFARIEDVRNFLWYFQRSAIVQHSTMAHFYTLMVQQKKSIEKEIQEPGEKKIN